MSFSPYNRLPRIFYLTILFFLAIVVINTDAVAQSATFSEANLITDQTDTPNAVFVADLDGDLDLDVISSSSSDDKIAWYENTDGAGAFGPQQVLYSAFDSPAAVFSVDLDGDDDFDVLSASYWDNTVAWFENSDGQGTFSDPQVISSSVNASSSLYCADLDGDDDYDVIAAANLADAIYWFENTDGAGTFGTARIITENADAAYSVFSIDVDGDGDFDVLSASYLDDKIAWYENTDGAGTFGTEQIISTGADGATCVFSADLDGDLDNDVLSSSFWDNKIAWYENTDGSGNFGSEQVLSDDMDGSYSVFASDLDNDGDNDVIAAASYGSKVSWFENRDGQGTFSSEFIIDDEATDARTVYCADLDNSGFPDIIATLEDEDQVIWYRNLNTIGVNDPMLPQVPVKFAVQSIYPNPFNPTTTIAFDLPVAAQVQLQVFDIHGCRVVGGLEPTRRYAPGSHTIPFDASGLPSGIYLYCLTAGDFTGLGKMVLLK